MTHSFLIDPVDPAETIKIGRGETKKIEFFVTNTSNRELDGEIKIEIEGGDASWFTPQVQVIPFQPKGKQKCVIEIATPDNASEVPPEKLKGKLRLVVTAQGTERDDDFTEGPYQNFEVTSDKDNTPPPSIRWWIWIIVGVVAVGIIIAVVVWLTWDTSAKLNSKCEKEEDCSKTPGLVCHPLKAVCVYVEGQSCAQDADCLSEYCPDTQCKQKPAAFKESCGEGIGCQADLACVEGQCLKNHGLPCEAETECVDNVCDPKRNICVYGDGHACAKDSDCVTEFCLEKVCAQKPAPFKESCIEAIGCQENLACVEGYCLRLVGQKCIDNGDCVSKVCKDGVCAQPDCEAGRPCSAAKKCGTGCECYGSKCRRTNGGPCMKNEDCLSNICYMMTCRENIPCHQGICPFRWSCSGSSGTVCEAASKCRSDQDCRSDEECYPPLKLRERRSFGSSSLMGISLTESVSEVLNARYCRPKNSNKPCTKNEECERGEVCQNRVCTAATWCESNSDCERLNTCDTKTGLCKMILLKDLQRLDMRRSFAR